MQHTNTVANDLNCHCCSHTECSVEMCLSMRLLCNFIFIVCNTFIFALLIIKTIMYEKLFVLQIVEFDI